MVYSDKVSRNKLVSKLNETNYFSLFNYILPCYIVEFLNLFITCNLKPILFNTVPAIPASF